MKTESEVEHCHVNKAQGCSLDHRGLKVTWSHTLKCSKLMSKIFKSIVNCQGASVKKGSKQCSYDKWQDFLYFNQRLF